MPRMKRMLIILTSIVTSFCYSVGDKANSKYMPNKLKKVSAQTSLGFIEDSKPGFLKIQHD